MRPQEIEAWVLSIVDRLASNEPLEDSRVELKAEWPSDLSRAARQLAGHCNAARGEPVLWIIGLDESRGIVGATRNELADWQSGIAKQFDGIVPELCSDLNVPAGDKTVVALLFATDRAPYVVKNSKYGERDGGPVEREVPWRQGTKVRSARREDLLRLLTPVSRLPQIETLSCTLTCKWTGPDALYWELTSELYLVPSSPDVLAIPFHKCSGRFRVPPFLTNQPFDTVSLRPRADQREVYLSDLMVVGPGKAHGSDRYRPGSHTVRATHDEVLVSGPGLVLLTGRARSAPFEGDVQSPENTWAARPRASYSIAIEPTGADRCVKLTGELGPKEQYEETVTWAME